MPKIKSAWKIMTISLGVLLILSLLWQYYALRDFQSEFDRIQAKSKAVLQYAVDQGVVFDEEFADEFGSVPEETEIEPVEVGVDDDPYTGNENAQATIIVFDDPQCPFSGKMHESLSEARKEFSGEELRIVYRDFPLPGHAQALPAAKAIGAAGKQDKFMEMADKVFANQDSLSADSYVQWAKELGLDIDKFEEDSASESIQEEIAKDIADAKSYGASGTPAVYLSGQQIGGYLEPDALIEIIQAELE